MDQIPRIKSMVFLRQGIYLLALSSPLFLGPVYSETNEEIKRFNDSGLNLNQFYIANGQDQKSSEPLVSISEVVIKGLENHPNKAGLEDEAYRAMKIRPGSKVTKSDVENDLNAIYASGVFSSVDIDAVNNVLGVRLVVKVKANPDLTKVEFNKRDIRISKKELEEIFKSDYGKTLNLNKLQFRMSQIRKWYLDRGYSLTKISGPNRLTSKGIVRLNIIEGNIERIDIQFINEEGNTVKENGKPVRGKTRQWVIKRQLKTKPGEVFNRNVLEEDIKRLYGTSLFSDLKVSLNPVPASPGKVIIVLGVTEQKTGSLTGGIGYSGPQGMFGSAGLKESNLLGRSWSSDLNFTYGEYGALINFSLTDPWIKGDKYRTSFRTNVFISRDVPMGFRSSSGSKFLGISDYHEASGTSIAYDVDHSVTGIGGPFNTVSNAKSNAPSTSWFEYEADSILLQRTGGGFSFGRPLNGGDPFKKAAWSALLGMSFQKVEPINYSGSERPYGVVNDKVTNNSANNSDVICIAFNCATENTLVSFKSALTRNKLDDVRNPTSGNYFTLFSEQYVSIGQNSPTFNKARASYSYFIPNKWLKLHKGCRPKPGEKFSCSQAIGFQVKAATIVGDLPPYEAFCLGGSKSVRGWSSCDLGVSRSYGEASAEYRFPIWRMVSGNMFLDAGTAFDSQKSVPGKPGELLDKKGSGFSPGAGLSFNTPLGPLRIEAANKDFGDDWRYNIGFGWKF